MDIANAKTVLDYKQKNSLSKIGRHLYAACTLDLIHTKYSNLPLLDIKNVWEHVKTRSFILALASAWKKDKLVKYEGERQPAYDNRLINSFYTYIGLHVKEYGFVSLEEWILAQLNSEVDKVVKVVARKPIVPLSHDGGILEKCKMNDVSQHVEMQVTDAKACEILSSQGNVKFLNRKKIGPFPDYFWMIDCYFNENFVSTGSGKNVKIAKRDAALKALRAIPTYEPPLNQLHNSSKTV